MAREMKDSGVEWIGEIPKNYQIYRLKYLLKSPLMYGANESGISFDESLPRYIRITDITMDGSLKESGKLSLSEECAANYILKNNDILFARSGASVGKAFIYRGCYGRSAFAGYLIKASVNSKILAEYLFLYTQSSIYEEWKKQIFIQATIQNIGADRYNNLPVVLPPIQEQEKIVACLNHKCEDIGAALNKIRSSIEEYKRLKQAVITQAVTKGIRGDRPMKDSGIGWVKEIPVEWDTIPSKHVFSNSDERKRPDDGLLTASQKYGIISQQKYMEKEDTRIVLATKGIEDWKHVEPHDFVISLRSFQGGLEMSEVSGCITWHYIVLKAKIPLHSFYFKWLFKSELYIKALQRTCNFIRDGQDLRYSNFTQVPLFIPPMKEQIDIANYLGKRCTEIDALIKQKEKLVLELEAYKKSLIYEYVTGKKEVQ